MGMLWIWTKEDVMHLEGTAPQCVVGNIDHLNIIDDNQ